jgi:hypothetical protein
VSGHCPLSNILKEHDISETAFVSVLRGKGCEAPTQLGLDNRNISELHLYTYLRSGLGDKRGR